MTATVTLQLDENVIVVLYTDLVSVEEQKEGLNQCFSLLAEYSSPYMDVLYLDRSNHFTRDQKLVGEFIRLGKTIHAKGGQLIVSTQLLNSAIARFFVTLAAGAAGVPAKVFTSEEEAWEHHKAFQVKNRV